MMREEEKLTRDAYLALDAKWKLKVFTNIAGSEQTHMDVVGNLLKTYSVADPVAGLAPGKFACPEFQQMYKDLVAAGSQSIVDALIVGATIEEIDIVDLLECLDRTTHADVRRAYSNIEVGSENREPLP